MTARRKPSKPTKKTAPEAQSPAPDATGGGASTADGDEPSFAELMAKDDSLTRPTKALRSKPRSEPAAKGARRSPRKQPGPLRFTFPDEGEALLGHASGIQRRTLRQLRAGRPSPERDIDLHGLSAREAKAELRRALATAASDRLRCVRVVHGRGLRSAAAGPVLKRLLPGWLADPSIGSAILAFAPAPPRAGGSGATLILLRAGQRETRRGPR